MNLERLERDRKQHAAWRAAWKKKHPNRVKFSRRNFNLAKYGLSLANYDKMLAEQNSNCAICLNSFGSSKPQVDHCHQTGKIRGLLCGACNSVLGFAKDSRATLLFAVEYLHRSLIDK